jgi:hypothetical protein
MRELHERLGDPRNAFAYYLHDTLVPNECDDYASNSGDGAALMGRRLLEWTDHGFASVSRFDDLHEARTWFGEFACSIGVHLWGEGRHSRLGGNWHWPCERLGCRIISLDDPEDIY